MICIKAYYGNKKPIIDHEQIRKNVNSIVFSEFSPNSLRFLWIDYFNNNFMSTYIMAKEIERKSYV